MKIMRGIWVNRTATSVVDGKPSQITAFNTSLSVHGFRGTGSGTAREHLPGSILNFCASLEPACLPTAQRASVNSMKTTFFYKPRCFKNVGYYTQNLDLFLG
jgi:hypothetical protein